MEGPSYAGRASATQPGDRVLNPVSSRRRFIRDTRCALGVDETGLSRWSVNMAESPIDALMQVSMGFTPPRTLHVIAELGIADALDDTPLSARTLARMHRRSTGRCACSRLMASSNGTTVHMPTRRALGCCARITRSPCARLYECKGSLRSGTSGSISTTRCGRVALRRRKRCRTAGFGAISPIIPSAAVSLTTR